MSTALRTYYRGHSLVAMRDEAAAQNRTFHFDHQETTQCLTNQAGVVTDRFAADAWGVEVKRTGTSINRQWYVGRWGYYRSSGQSCDYVRARHYSGVQGRWLSRDPLAAAVGFYTYAANRPVGHMDPSGLAPICHRPFDDCLDACGNTRHCDDCDPLSIYRQLGLVHPQCIQLGDCRMNRCEPYAAREGLMIRLLRLGIVDIGIYCRGGLRRLPGMLRPWGYTMCCEKDGRCVGKTICLDCPSTGSRDPADERYPLVDGCIQECLMNHEREHRFQCRRPTWPAHPDDRLGRECRPYQIECRCICEQLARVSHLFQVAQCETKCCQGPRRVEECLNWLRPRAKAVGIEPPGAPVPGY